MSKPYSLYIEEIDENNKPIKTIGKRVHVLPRKDEVIIVDDKMYGIIAVTHDYDQEEHVTYVIVRFLRMYPRTDNIIN